MRLALLMDLAPRKLGSFEAWVTALCREALWRGHRVDVFGRYPVHPAFARELASLGADWRTLEQIERRPLHAARLLAARYDVLHLNLLPPRGPVALAAYAAWPARVLYMARSDWPETEPASLLHQAARSLADRVTFLRVDGLAGVSDFLTKRESARFGLHPPRARTIYNGVDIQRFRVRPPRRPGLNILTVAYLAPRKGVHHLLGAFARLNQPQARLCVVGDGPEASNLAQLAVQKGISERVTFLGLRDDVHLLMSDADLFVHPCLNEGFGLTVAEAMACGRAVIASRAGGIPEIIEDGHSGLLVPPGDEERLAAAMELLLTHVPYRRELEENARRRVCEHFNVRVTVKNHLDWCEEAFARRPRLSSRMLSWMGRRPDTSLAPPAQIMPPWAPRGDPAADEPSTGMSRPVP